MSAQRHVWLARDHALTARAATLIRGPFTRALAASLAHSGDSLVWLAVSVLLWRFGIDGWARAGERILLVTAVTWVVSTVLKYFIQRPRPPGEQGLFYLKIDRHSFPSGHAVRIGGLWVVLAGLLTPWGVAFLLLWGVSVGLSRVALGLHYAGDVLAGWLIGAGVGLALLAFL
ncbi:MAG: phosphatase PAP2 family protein [Anaerolineae bacterium]